MTGVFLLADPENVSTEVLTAALHGQTGLDTAVVVTSSPLAAAVEQNLQRLMDEAAVTYRHVVQSPEQSLADQLEHVLHDCVAAAKHVDAQSWLWFIPEGTVVSEDALTKQLQAVEVSPSVAIAGTKQLSQRQLIDVGLSVAKNGETLAMIEPGELDQGQYDHRTDIFAVSLPGMLIKTEVFQHLNGFDTHTPKAVQAVDLCWRARLAGHRVAIVPGAQIQHETPPAQPTETQVWEHARWLRLKHTGFFGLVGGWLWGVATALFMLAAGLVTKDPATGAARANGIFRTLGRIRPLFASRKAAKTTRTRPFMAVDELRPSRAQVRDFHRSVQEDRRPQRVIGDGTGVSATPQQATGGHDDFDELATPERNWVGVGAVTLAALFGAVALLGLRHLLGAPALAGGNLLPVSQDLSVLAAKAASGWAYAGVGAPGYDGPFGWLLVLFGLTGNASITLVILWLLALPLAGLGAWALAGTISSSRYIRFAAGLVWAAAPMFLTALSEGRLGGVLTHLLLPWFVLALLRAIGYRADDITLVQALRQDLNAKPTPPARLGRTLRDGTTTTSLTAAAWAAILLTAITAAAPSMFVPLTVGVIVILLLVRPATKVLWWIPLLAATALLPAVVTHRTDVRAILADPGAPAGFDPAPAWQQLLGLPHHIALDAGVAELPWLDSFGVHLPWNGILVGVLALPLLVLALVGAIAPGRGGGLARTGILTAVIGVAIGTINGGLIFAIDQTGQPVALSTIPPVSLTWIGLLMAAVIGLNYLAVPKSQLRTTLTTVRLRGGWPVRSATSILVITGIVATGVWLTPRITPAETLNQARAEALEERGIATALAATDQQVEDASSATLQHLLGAPAIQKVAQRALPATAVDAGVSDLHTRTLVITRTSEGIRTHLMSGAGTMLDDMTGTWTTRSVTGTLLTPQPAGSDDADNALRTVAAQLTSGSDTDPRTTLNALGAGFVVLTDPTGTETAMAASIDSAPGLAPVGHTRAGWLWRVTPTTSQPDDAETQLGVPVLTQNGQTPPRGTATARARIIEDGTTVALAATNPNGSVTVELPAGAENRQLVLAERANPGFRAVLNGQELEAVATDPEWIQAFNLPAEGGQLTVEYAPTVGKWVWLIPGVLGIIMLLLGIPTRRKTRANPNGKERQ